jgi:hypothetical protein
MLQHLHRVFIPALFTTGVCSLTASTLCVNPGGTGGCSSTIGAAITAASPGDIIIVEGGTYKETVVIDKSLRLLSTDPANTVIDATGLTNGIYVDGIDNPGLADVMVGGFTVRNANAEGILVTNSSAVTLYGNHVVSNNRTELSSQGCDGYLAPCGGGIQLQGTDHAVVANNSVNRNGGGILINDGAGATAHHNLVIGNEVVNNPKADGIQLNSEQGAGIRGDFGVFQNTVAQNTSSRNGLSASASGIGIYAPTPRQSNIFGNVAIGNQLAGNGANGILLLTRVPFGPTFDDVFAGNTISGNGGSGGIGISISGEVEIDSVIGNLFKDEATDLAVSAENGFTPLGVTAHLNSFTAHSTGINNSNSNFGMDPAGTVDATENWWGCPGGPTKCSGVVAPAGTVLVTPFLTKAPPPPPLPPGL